MSGDATLLDTKGGAVSRLVRAAATLFDRPRFAPAALVGGLAVTVRLATVHRATNDVDAVSDGDRPREFALEYLGDADASGTDRIEIDGVKVDVMATAPLPEDASDLPDGELDRLFVLGHRWALETAAQVSVQVVAADGPVVEGKFMVATPPALVACKLHALADRRDTSAAKRESDALDIVRLTADLIREPGSAQQFEFAPFDLAALVASEVERWLIDGAAHTAGLIQLGVGTAGAAMGARDVAALGGAFVETIETALRSTGAADQ